MSVQVASRLASAAPRLAIIVPIFKHSSLLIEAIEAVLAQRFGRGLRLLLVNDGCPFAETDAVCSSYAMGYPDVITYLRKANGGLSDARNCGIRYVLDHLPSVEAVYMLDADNRLQPDAMSRAFAALDENVDADWIYPNIDMFGMDWHGDYGGDYSLLIHSAMNICEAGSLIRRRVFEAGVLFDTGFKLGWEDWDFFISAARRGFRGKNIEDFGFLYRKRAESMLADSGRDQSTLLGAIQQKHKDLFTLRNLLALEQAEAPRYAIYLPEQDKFLYCVDPTAPDNKLFAFKEFETSYANSIISPGCARIPPYIIVLSADAFEGLRQIGLLHWALWKLQAICESGSIAVLTLKAGNQDRFSVDIDLASDGSGHHQKAIACAIPKILLDKCIQDGTTDWIDTLTSSNPQPSVSTLGVRIPENASILVRHQRPNAVFSALEMIHRIRASQWHEALKRQWNSRQPGVTLRGLEHTIPARLVGGAAVLPKVADGRKHIGFLLPMAEFGGVEKVALNVARGLRGHGWIPHAFVLEANDIAYTAEWNEVFESTNLLADPSFSAWGGGSQDYMGTNVPAWSQTGPHGPVLGMLHWLDAAINFHGGAIVGIMGELRRLGIKTLNSLHINDLTPMNRPTGNTYLGIAYEHAFDYYLPCSRKLGDWLHGFGIPRDKIVTVRNAPGFGIDPAITARGIAARRNRSGSQPLRALYLGRLDRQKGLDRLAEAIRRTEAEGLDVTWRVLGEAVMSHDALSCPPEITAVLEPPALNPDDLAAAFAWADVVVLLSRYEGLPLTVLEAMRAGAVVIVTDVGAVSEVVQDGVTGVLVSSQNAAQECSAALRRFSQNREELAAIADRVLAEDVSGDWQKATAELAAKLAE